MPDYSRQDMIGSLRVPEAVTVVGAGGLGSWVSLLATLSGVRRLVLYAPGTVLASDLARFPFPPEAEGMARGDALRTLLQKLRPDLELEVNGPWYEDKEPTALAGVVFNCAAGPDGFDARLHKSAQRQGLKYVSGAYRDYRFLVFNEDGPELEPQQEPVGTWTAVLAFTSALMLSSGFVQSQTIAGEMTAVHRVVNSLAAGGPGSDLAR